MAHTIRYFRMAAANNDQDLKCKCGLPGASFEVKKDDSQLLGKTIIVCPKDREDPGRCKMFVVEGEPPRDLGLAAKKCTWTGCNRVMDQFRAKHGAHTGRGFHKCAIHERFVWD
jgi:hypothetical protein